MKNIHVIPTDKPSRLYKNEEKLILTKIKTISLGFNDNQNIYITNSEEIEKDEWCIDNSNEVFKFQKFMNYNHYKKIILTTDQDLIKDDVQAIDDEFLEWFVKNPICEEVETKISLDYKLDTFGNAFFGYNIISPKEELKQSTKDRILSETPELVKQKVRETANKLVEPKQETLEEAAIYNYKELYEGEPLTQDVPIDAFIKGAKWQSERSYSEEDLKTAFLDGWQLRDGDLPFPKAMKKWFEQFKNK
jgi:hypothetical protein